MSSKRRRVFKVVVLGDCGVGKTSLIRFLAEGVRANENYKATIGVDFSIKQLGNDTSVHLWDIAGQERVARTFVRVFYQNAGAALLVCDVTDVLSFESLRTWKDTLDRFVAEDDFPVFLLANKSDLKSSISRKEVDDMCRELGCAGWAWTSAVTGDNVEEALKTLVVKAHERRRRKRSHSEATASMANTVLLDDSDDEDRPADESTSDEDDWTIETDHGTTFSKGRRNTANTVIRLGRHAQPEQQQQHGVRSNSSCFGVLFNTSRSHVSSTVTTPKTHQQHSPHGGELAVSHSDSITSSNSSSSGHLTDLLQMQATSQDKQGRCKVM